MVNSFTCCLTGADATPDAPAGTHNSTAGSATPLICVVLLPTKAGTTTKSSKHPPDNRLNATPFCNFFPCTYVSVVPAGLGEDEGSCDWTLGQQVARSGLPCSLQMRRFGMSEDSGSKAAFPQCCSWGEGSVAPGSHRATSLPCQQQKIHAAMHRPEELLPQLPCRHPARVPTCWRGRVVPGEVLPEAACAAPQVPATDATAPSN